MAAFEATWDSANDWTLFTATGGADSAATRVTSPGVKYLGAVGRLTDNWTAGTGAFDIYRSVELTPARRATWTIALRPILLGWSGGGVQTRNGPLLIRCRNDAGGNLGQRGRLNVLRDTSGNVELRFYESSSASVSAEMVNLRARLDSWLLFRFELESTGTAAPYTVKMLCRVMEARGTREKLLATLVVPAPATDIFDFAGFAIGFLSLEKNSDFFDLHVDECRIGTGEGAPWPRPRRGAISDFPLTVRLRRWDEGASTWRSAWEIAASDVVDLHCRFLAHRVEEACELVVADPGGIWATKTQDVLSDLEEHSGSLYRLDVHCPQEDHADPQFPSGFVDQPIFWSGVLNAKSFRVNKATRQVEILALGWTSMLERIETESRFFAAGTVLSDVVDDAVTDLNARWPGTLVRLPDDPGSSIYGRVLASNIRARQVRVADLLTQVTSGGSYFFGVTVSGYPLDDEDEFRFIFFESRAEIRSARAESTAGSLGDTLWRTVDLEDERVRHWERSTDEEDVVNRWVFHGKPFILDLHVLPRIGDFIALGAPLNRVREHDLLDYDVPTGGTLEPWEGVEIIFEGHALSPGDNGTAGFPAGLIDEAPEALQGEHVVSDSIRSSAAFTDFEIETFFESQAPTSGYLLGVIRNTSAQRVRTAEDRSQTSARNSITKSLDDPDVDGTYLANLRAMRDLFASVRNSRRARLVVNGWRGPPGDQIRNVVGILEGNTRITRYGTTGEGGDGYVYNQDSRPIGAARRYEIRTVDASWNEGGWELTFTLGSAPQDLSSRLRPEALK